MRSQSVRLVFPQYTMGERVADFVVHVIGITGSVAGVAVLLAIAIDTLPVLSVMSVAIYGIGVFAVFCCSAAYNFVSHYSWKSVFRRLDHAAIYVKIAATYTPFVALKMATWAGAFLLLVVWSVAAFGLTLKLWFPERMVKTSYVLYLTQGWSALLVAQPLAGSVSNLTLVLLFVGGLLYTIGVLFHFWHSLRYHNATWHAFVVAGSSCHFLAVMDTVGVNWFS
jgi:hemolysin III